MTEHVRPVLLQLRWAVDPAQEAEFDRWYDEEHLADLCAIPGVGIGRRFLRVEAAYSSPSPYNHLTLYEADSVDAFNSPEYRALAESPSPWTRRVAFPLPRARELATALGALPPSVLRGRALVHVFTRADAEVLPEFHAWYDEEHLPALASVPGVCSARRYRILEPDPAEFSFVAVYELEDPSVALGDEWMRQGRSTKRRERMGARLQSHVQLYREVRRLGG